MRTDPTDNGGLFVGRRPGTRPIKYRALPQRGDDRRRRIDNANINVALSNSFGFGGTNASLVFQRLEK